MRLILPEECSFILGIQISRFVAFYLNPLFRVLVEPRDHLRTEEVPPTLIYLNFVQREWLIFIVTHSQTTSGFILGMLKISVYISVHNFFLNLKVGGLC